MPSDEDDEIEIVETPRGILEHKRAVMLAMAFPVIYTDEKYHHYQGSAFQLFDLECGQMVFATAKHILEPIYEEWTKDAFILMPHLDGDKPSRTHMARLQIDGVWGSKNNNDIALIRCDRRSIGDVPLARSLTTLKIAPAVVGEVTIALGFTGHMHIEPDKFKRIFRISHGIVRELHHGGAGTNPLVNFPMFQTSGQYDPGMSGGPVLDQNGKCIGIVAHGMSEHEGVESVGFATSIACLGELGIDLEMDDGTTKHFKVPELTGGLILLSEDGPAVTLVHDENGLHLDWPSGDQPEVDR